MQVYLIAAACVIFVCSVILFLINRKKNSRSLWVTLFIAIASFICAISVPNLYGYISSTGGSVLGLTDPVYYAAAVIVAYLAIIFVLSLIISYAASRIAKPKEVKEPDGPLGETVYDDTAAQKDQAAAAQGTSGHKGNYLEQIFRKFELEHNREPDQNNSLPTDTVQDYGLNPGQDPVQNPGQDFEQNLRHDLGQDTGLYPGQNFFEPAGQDIAQEIIGGFELGREGTNIGEKAENTEINIEKSVDRTEIIDKMGIEIIGQTGENLAFDENLTLEDCIEKAFSLKKGQDFESAILYFMYALDKKPSRQLAFWIVLDICTMYKELGQKEMALDILNGYYEIYGDVMDVAVREEIERNLRDETFEPVI